MSANEYRAAIGSDKISWKRIVVVVVQLCEYFKPLNCTLQKDEFYGI